MQPIPLILYRMLKHSSKGYMCWSHTNTKKLTSVTPSTSSAWCVRRTWLLYSTNAHTVDVIYLMHSSMSSSEIDTLELNSALWVRSRGCIKLNDCVSAIFTYSSIFVAGFVLPWVKDSILFTVLLRKMQNLFSNCSWNAYLSGSLAPMA